MSMAEIEFREFRTPLPNTQLQVYARNKRKAGAALGPERTLLMVHVR